MHLSFPKTNVPFAAMLYNAKKMRTAEADEVKNTLTWICCFMDAEAAWEGRSQQEGVAATHEQGYPGDGDQVTGPR